MSVNLGSKDSCIHISMNFTPYEQFKDFFLRFSNFLVRVLHVGDSCCSKTPIVGDMFHYSTGSIIGPV